MLTQLRIQNFKAWQDTGPIRLAPLTVIFGANSAGKSSLGQLMLALQQTARRTERRPALFLGDAGSPIDLGGFVDCIHGRDLNRALAFEIGWQLPAPLALGDPCHPRAHYRGEQMRLAVELQADPQAQPEVRRLHYELLTRRQPVLDVSWCRDPVSNQTYRLNTSRYPLQRAERRPWPLQAPEKFYRLSERCVARYENAGFLTDFALATEAMLDGIHYLGPFRHRPQRQHGWDGQTPTSVGQMGEHTIGALLSAQAAGRRLACRAGEEPQRFGEFIAGWLQQLGIIHGFSVHPTDRHRGFEVRIRTSPHLPEVPISDVGFGVSQLLPALVQAFYVPPDSTVWIEQPEIHLHPQVQAELADVFICAIQATENGLPRNTQLVLESHSEYFLNRLQRRVAEGSIEADQVAVYFCRRSGDHAELDPLRLNAYGEIENWPENFFGDEMADIAGRSLAALQRKRRQREEPAVHGQKHEAREHEAHDRGLRNHPRHHDATERLPSSADERAPGDARTPAQHTPQQPCEPS
ncbi:MAG: DUF3696 domain-containing protein [Lautropia sp.]|nr:DUF3696 domain-containing protein [Lautropia sp.]